MQKKTNFSSYFPTLYRLKGLFSQNRKLVFKLKINKNRVRASGAISLVYCTPLLTDGAVELEIESIELPIRGIRLLCFLPLTCITVRRLMKSNDGGGILLERAKINVFLPLELYYEYGKSRYREGISSGVLVERN